MTKSQNTVYQSVTEAITKKAAKDRKRKATDSAKASRRQSKYSKVDNTTAARRAYSRHDNGSSPADITDDLSPEILTDLMGSFYSVWKRHGTGIKK